MAICVSVFGSFLLQMYVIVEMVWSNLARQWVKSLDSAEKGNGEEYGESTSSQSSSDVPSHQCCPLIPAKFKLASELCFRTFMVTVCCSFPNVHKFNLNIYLQFFSLQLCQILSGLSRWLASQVASFQFLFLIKFPYKLSPTFRHLK